MTTKEREAVATEMWEVIGSNNYDSEELCDLRTAVNIRFGREIERLEEREDASLALATAIR